MRLEAAILVLGLLGAETTSTVECAPWTGRRVPRLAVKQRGGFVTVGFRGWLPTYPGRTLADASVTLTAGELGSAILDGENGPLVVKQGRRSRHVKLRGAARFPRDTPPLDAVPASLVVTAPGYCTMARFELANCRGGRGRRRCRAEKAGFRPELDALAGSFDATWTVGSETRPALAAIGDASTASASLDLRRSPYESTTLHLTRRGDGRITLSGVCAPADYIAPASGFLYASSIERGLRLDGDLDCEGIEDQPVRLTLVRRSGPPPSSLSGVYALRLAGVTTATVQLVIDELGTAASMPTEDRDESDSVIGTIDAGTGFVGPGGVVWLTAPYRPVGDDGLDPLRISLFGRLVSSDATTPAGGSFYVGSQPVVERAGSWTVE